MRQKPRELLDGAKHLLLLMLLPVADANNKRWQSRACVDEMSCLQRWEGGNSKDPIYLTDDVRSCTGSCRTGAASTSPSDVHHTHYPFWILVKIHRRRRRR